MANPLLVPTETCFITLSEGAEVTVCSPLMYNNVDLNKNNVGLPVKYSFHSNNTNIYKLIQLR